MFEPAAASTLLSRAANGPLSIFVGRSVYAASQFAMLAAVGRCCGTNAVGDVVLGLAIAVPLFALFGGQLRIVQATDSDERFAFRAVERAGLIGHGLGLLLLSAMALAFRFDIVGFATLLGVGLARTGESWSEIAYGALQRQRRFAAIGTSTALKSVAGSTVAVLILVQTQSPGAAFAASGVVWLVASACIDRPLAKRRFERGSSEPGSSIELLRRSFPLSAGATVSTFDTQVPRYFVDAFLGSRALGLFGVTHYAAVSILTLIVPLTYAWTPALAADFARGDRDAFRRKARRALAIAGFLGTATALAALPAGPFLATVFSEPAIVESWTFALALSAAGCLAPAAVFESVLRAAHGFRLLCVLQIVSLIVHLGACTSGLAWFGVEGVAGGMLVRSIVYLGMLGIGSRFVVRKAFADAVGAANPLSIATYLHEETSRRRAA